DPAHRRRLVIRAPLAYPGWRNRVRTAVSGEAVTVDVLVTSNARRGAEVFGRVLTEHLINRGWIASLVSLRGSPPPGVGALVLSDEERLGGLRLPVLAGL